MLFLRRVAAFSLVTLLFLNVGACIPVDCADTDIACQSGVSLLTLLLLRTTPLWVAVGATGSIAHSDDGATNWQSVGPGTGGSLFGVTYGAAGFVAVGQAGRMLTSPNGLTGTWVERSAVTTDALNDVLFAEGIYVAVGGVNGSSDRILTSTDGQNWTDRTPGIGNTLKEVIYAQGAFLAVGQSGVRAFSDDGITWSNVNVGGNTWDAVAFGNGIYLQENSAGAIHTATTVGGFPNATGTHASANLESAIYFPRTGQFVLGGDDGQAYTTSNGVGAATAGPVFSGAVHWDMTTNGQSVLIGSSGGELSQADDGVNFTVSVLGVGNWNGVAYADVRMQ